MLTRLHSKYPELADAISAAPENKIMLLRKLVIQTASENAGLDDHLKDKASHAAETGEAPEAIFLDRILEDRNRHEEKYMEAQDQLAEGSQLSEAALQSFRMARACDALLMALKGATPTDLIEAAYETLSSSTHENTLSPKMLSVVSH